MNVRLHYTTDFSAGVYYNQRLFINSYTVNIELLTQTEEREAINIAMDRLKAFIEIELAHTIFIQDTQVDEIIIMDDLGFNLTTMPEVPLDQIVGLMLYCKLNAIMEDRMIVTSLDISSVAGDRVWYLHEEDEPIGPFANEGWWNDPGPNHCPDVITTDNVFKVSVGSWSERGLAWEEDTHDNNTVVYANFGQNEN
jgi:hypothetical protein